MGERFGVSRLILWFVAAGVGFLLQGSMDIPKAYAGHTDAGAWAEHPDIIYCIHCHKEIIVAGNPDGSNREIAGSPSITSTSRSTHAKRDNWGNVSYMLGGKCGSNCAGSNAALILSYENTYYCILCKPPYYSITATPTSTSATIGYQTGYASSNGQVCYGTSSGTMTTCVSETGSGTSHSIALTGLTANTTYSYKILFADSTGRSFDTSVNGAETLSTPAISDSEPPTMPTNVTAASNGLGNQVTLTWTASTDNLGVGGYNIYRDGGTIPVGSSTSATFTDSGLTPGTTYSYQVEAFDMAGNKSAKTAPIQVTTTNNTDFTPPSTPANVGAVSDISGTEVFVMWDPSTDNVGVASYNIYRSGGATLVGSSATTVFMDLGLSPGIDYSYQVEAVDVAGNVSLKSAPFLINPTAPIERASINTGGGQRTTDSSGTSISSDGRYVAFESLAGSTRQIFVRDRVAELTDLASVENNTQISVTSTVTVIIRAKGPSMGPGVPGVLADPTLKLYAGQTVIAENDNWQDPPNCAAGYICQTIPAGLAPPNSNESAILITLPPGLYGALVRGANSGTGIGLIEFYDQNTVALPKLTNGSGRAWVGTGAQVDIGGINIQGTEPKTVLFRGDGPSLGRAPWNIPGALADPTISIYSFSSSSVIAQNDNWQDPPNCVSGYTCGAVADTGLAPTDPKESAILITLPPGNYSVILAGLNSTTGIGLVGMFEADPTTPSKLIATSARGFSGLGDQLLIGGLIIGGNNSGIPGNGNSQSPSISGDGRYVAFSSDATDLVSGDTNGVRDIFVHDRQTGTTERVSVDSNGVAGDQGSARPSISGDGRYVAFSSDATNLVSGDSNSASDVFVRDRQTGTTERVSVDGTGVAGNGSSVRPSISGDGRYVAFESSATNLVIGDTNGAGDIFVRDRLLGTTERVSVSSGIAGNGSSGSPSISGDGRYVAFESSATNLVVGDTNGAGDIFVHDRQAGTTERVSVDGSGVAGNGSSGLPSISGDGRYVAFESSATNLVSGDVNSATDIFVHDRQTGATGRLSVSGTGAGGNSGSTGVSISSDSGYAAFSSTASNLVTGDTNGKSDVFVRALIMDADGDGWEITADCNDSAAGVHPGADEIPNDGIDQDCSGSDLTMDLVMTAVGGPSSAERGDNITISSTVQNTGAVAVGAFDIGLYLSSDATITASDVRIGTRSVSGLAGGASSPGNTPVTIPGTGTAGTYYLGAIADAGLAIAESNESNNAMTGNSIAITIPPPPVGTDLVMTAVSSATTGVQAGKTLALSNTVKNQGTASAGGFSIAFHLSSDGLYGGGDDVVLTATRAVASLAAGASSASSTTLTVPASTPVGSYHVCALADSANAVSEVDEGNNSLCTAATISVTVPDLVMTAVTPNAGTVSGTGTLSVSSTAKNEGVVSSGSFLIGFRLSVNLVYGDGDDVTVVTTRTVSTLAAGASNTANATLAVPTTTAAGSYHVCAKADSGNTVTETDETNNTVCSTAQVTVPSADLVMTAVSSTTTVIAPGKVFSLSNTVNNQGLFPAGSFSVGFHLSPDGVYGGSDDVAMTTTRTVNSLAGGASNAAATNVTVPATAPIGNYHVCALADSGNTVDEAGESNNGLCTATTIAVTLPDLVVTQVSPGASVVNAGATLSVSETVRNAGLIAAGAFRVAYHLSVNGVYGDGDDVVISTIRTVTSLVAGGVSSATTSLAIPPTAPPGTYSMCVMADSLTAVLETDETNNVLCSATQVTVPPVDLVMTALSTTATTVVAGHTFSASNTVQNPGGKSAVGFSIGFHLSADPVFGGADDFAMTATRAVASLAAGASSTASTSLTVPVGTPSGSYYVCAMADSTGTVVEGDETNNARCTAATITVP